MFLRGYGSQDYAQYNRNIATENGIVPYKKTNTTYSSGKLGEIQGDGERYWITYSWMNLSLSNPTSGNPVKINNNKYFSNRNWYWQLYKEGGDSVHYYTGYEHLFGEDIYTVYLPLEESPCSSSYGIPLSFTSFGYSNALDNPIANEIRPVNVAVRYYIKAK